MGVYNTQSTLALEIALQLLLWLSACTHTSTSCPSGAELMGVEGTAVAVCPGAPCQCTACVLGWAQTCAMVHCQNEGSEHLLSGGKEPGLSDVGSPEIGE